jgi:hypothetical protein
LITAALTGGQVGALRAAQWCRRCGESVETALINRRRSGRRATFRPGSAMDSCPIDRLLVPVDQILVPVDPDLRKLHAAEPRETL